LLLRLAEGSVNDFNCNRVNDANYVNGKDRMFLAWYNTAESQQDEDCDWAAHRNRLDGRIRDLSIRILFCACLGRVSTRSIGSTDAIIISSD
jgi:hypothetical protein